MPRRRAFVMVIAVAAAALLASAGAATAAAEPVALVAVTPRSPWTLRELEALGVAFASYDPDTGVAMLLVTAAEQQRLHAAGFALATLDPDIASRAGDAGTATRDLGLYHTYAESEALLRDLAARFPEACRLESLGPSLEGRAIWALKISDFPAEDDASEPDVLVMGCHHAREFMSVEVPLHLARTLLEGAATSPQLQRLIATRELWVVPIVNPDGHVFQEEYAAGPDWAPPGWRKNRRPNFDGSHGVDLNRNYGYMWGYDDEGSSPDGPSETYRGVAPFSEPETQAVRALVERQRFIIALSYHSFGRLWLYPWGHTRHALTEDHLVFATLADSMVRSNGYRAGNAYLGTIYLTNGECTDYLYGELDTARPQRTFAFTPELNGSGDGGFWPPDDRIAPTCAAMWPANLFALEVAAAPRRPLPPPAPVLTAVQDALDRRRIRMSWLQPVDGDNPVAAWEVFEIATSTPPAVRSGVLTASGRAVLATGLARPQSQRLVLEFEARLAPAWDYAYVEARAPGGEWVRLRGPATRDTAPTGRNRGAGLTGGQVARKLEFDVAPVDGATIDVAVSLDAAAPAPQPASVHARLDWAATYVEERRVLATGLRVPHYDVMAERAGLFAYGVTAVDADGQVRDSELQFFVIPTVAVALSDVHLSRAGDVSALEWTGDVRDARLEIWARPLRGGEALPSAVAAWQAGDLVLAASAAVTAASGGRIEWLAPAARELVVLRVVEPGGDRLAGVWALESAWATRIVAVEPNPLRGAGHCDFELARSGHAEVSVHAVDGRRVRTLWSQARPAGRSRLLWDGRDDAGRRVAAGVYFVRLRQAGATSTARVVVLH
jgi:hypothetical protein